MVGLLVMDNKLVADKLAKVQDSLDSIKEVISSLSSTSRTNSPAGTSSSSASGEYKLGRDNYYNSSVR